MKALGSMPSTERKRVRREEGRGGEKKADRQERRKERKGKAKKLKPTERFLVSILQYPNLLWLQWGWRIHILGSDTVILIQMVHRTDCAEH